MLKLIKCGFLVLLLCGGGLLTVACQTKEQKSAAVLKKCQSLLDKDDVPGASTCYAEAVAADSDNGGEISKAGKTAVFDKCVEFKERKDYRNAIICFDGFTELEPQMANNYFYLGYSYYQYFKEEAKAAGQPDVELLDRAEEAIKTGLKIKPDDAPAHSYYGEILRYKGDKQKSVTEHQIATKLSPRTIIFWIKLAQAQENLLQDEEAIKSYRQALDIDQNDTLALYFMGLQYERMKKFDDALQTYEKILKIEPSDEEVLQRIKTVKEQIESQKQTKPPENKTEPPKKKAKAVGVPNSRSNL